MKKTYFLVLVGIGFLANTTAVCQNTPQTQTTFQAPKPAASAPEETVKQFYRWYMDYLMKNEAKAPPEAELRKFVTANLLDEFKKKNNDPHFFLQSPEWDPAWGKNVAILNAKRAGEGAHVEARLSGKMYPQHQLNLALIREPDGWKIDHVQAAIE